MGNRHLTSKNEVKSNSMATTKAKLITTANQNQTFANKYEKTKVQKHGNSVTTLLIQEKKRKFEEPEEEEEEEEVEEEEEEEEEEKEKEEEKEPFCNMSHVEFFPFKTCWISSTLYSISLNIVLKSLTSFILQLFFFFFFDFFLLRFLLNFYLLVFNDTLFKIILK